MKIFRATTPDGRVFRAVDDRYHVTPAASPVQAGARRNEITLPRTTPASHPLPRGLGPIVRPQAAYRWLLPQLAAITPQYIETILRGALAGSHVQQWELFDLMLDTWPELSACAQELTYGVLAGRKLIFEPFAEEGEQPTPNALERCRLVSAALRRMRPDPAADENDLEGTLLDLLDGWFRGVTALEVAWQTSTTTRHGTIIAPRSTSWVHPTCFAFDPTGRLALRLELPNTAAAPASPWRDSRFTQQAASLTPFPPHKFLLGIHKAKSGSALGGALLRPLAWWWCAANFSADWLLNLSQIFGLPFRWANYDPSAPEETVSRVCTMLQQMGSSGWAAFPAGTSMQLLDGGGRGSDHSPQGELLDRADRYARLLVLGQTMSGSQDASKGGGKAFGEVESDVKSQRLEAADRYACRVLNTQLIPSILELNYGDAEEAPTARLLSEAEGDLNAAHRDQVLAAAGVRIPVSYLRKKYGIPEPTEDEDVIGGKQKKAAASDRSSFWPDKAGDYTDGKHTAGVVIDHLDVDVEAHNENHDRLGQFTTSAGRGSATHDGSVLVPRSPTKPKTKVSSTPAPKSPDPAATKFNQGNSLSKQGPKPNAESRNNPKPATYKKTHVHLATAPNSQGKEHLNVGGRKDKLAVRAPSAHSQKRRTYFTAFKTTLKSGELGRSRTVHFHRANGDLHLALKSKAKFAARMEKLIPEIAHAVSPTGGRKTPRGWVWHHDQKRGVMRLVRKEDHTPGSIHWKKMHPRGRGGYARWAVPNGAPPNSRQSKTKSHRVIQSANHVSR